MVGLKRSGGKCDGQFLLNFDIKVDSLHRTKVSDDSIILLAYLVFTTILPDGKHMDPRLRLLHLTADYF